jgi:hypothetical protein
LARRCYPRSILFRRVIERIAAAGWRERHPLRPSLTDHQRAFWEATIEYHLGLARASRGLLDRAARCFAELAAQLSTGGGADPATERLRMLAHNNAAVAWGDALVVGRDDNSADPRSLTEWASVSQSIRAARALGPDHPVLAANARLLGYAMSSVSGAAAPAAVRSAPSLPVVLPAMLVDALNEPCLPFGLSLWDDYTNELARLAWNEVWAHHPAGGPKLADCRLSCLRWLCRRAEWAAARDVGDGARAQALAQEALALEPRDRSLQEAVRA